MIQIADQDWLNLEQSKDLRVNKDPKSTWEYIEYKPDRNSDFEPILCLSKDYNQGSMNSATFLRNPKLTKGICKVAEQLQAIIFGEELEIYFIPSIGQLHPNFFPDTEVIQIEISD